MDKIEQLTPEQERKLVEFRSEWFRWGTCTYRADRAKAETAILAMRKEIGIDRRPIVFWGRSPLECLLILWVIKSKTWRDLCKRLGDQLWGQLGGQLWGQLGDQLGGQLGDQLWGQLRGQLRGQLWGQLRGQLRGQLGDQRWGQLGGQLGGQLWGQLRDQLGDQLRGQLGGQLRDQLGEELGREWWGQHESCWISFYLFCRDILDTKHGEVENRRLNLWRDIAQSCCWWWCYENYVVISERPTVCRMTEQEGRLHCEGGPALAFADGYSLWKWHGVTVAEDVIAHPEQLTVARIEKETNAEVRRVMLERYGEARYLQDSGAQPIHTDKYGVLYRKEVPGDEPIVMVRVENSTPEADGKTKKIYWLRVPPTIETAREAVAWTFGVESKDYRPIMES